MILKKKNRVERFTPPDGKTYKTTATKPVWYQRKLLPTEASRNPSGTKSLETGSHMRSPPTPDDDATAGRFKRL